MTHPFERFRNSTDFYQKLQEWNAKQQSHFAANQSLQRVFSKNFYQY